MGQELSKVYEPKAIENWVSEIWFSGGYFHAEPSADGRGPKPYTIVIPPPNVTAPLHLGHALNNTLQDILIRFHRMRQFNTLWMPGTDHAGIATQTVVEKRLLAEQGKKRTDFERDEFIAHVQAWKDEYEATIISQLKAMGCSCDWQRIRFTMDEVCTKAVRAAFFKLFKDGLIYRGKRLVNWDPATQTVLADDEVEHETVQGYFWYLRYPLVELVKIGNKQIEYVTVATTRPETMLGDTAVAMNPADPRAKYLIGRKVRLPIVGRIIPIIADEHVVLPEAKNHGQDARDTDEKAKFSTGFLKVTPAHDPDDWEIGQRHNLEVINVLAPDASISDKYGWTDWEQIKNPDVENLIGMDRFEAREAIVEWFRKENLLEDVKEYVHEVGHSYRSHVPIEPYLSDQWYIAVKTSLVTRDPCPVSCEHSDGHIEGTDVPVNSLAGLALKPLLDGRLRFIPERYANTYKSWLENLRDWPISRQLWWGHQIPVWKILEKELFIRSKEFFERLEKAKKGRTTDSILFLWPTTFGEIELATQIRTEDGKDYLYICIPGGNPNVEKELESMGCKRDTDVLDTWFSSALWPFSTMGWTGDKKEDNKNEVLKAFYPGNVLCTAREIITLWVSRMVMMGQYCAGDIPFSDVYIHAMIQDGEGRKMSKSLGNGIDPLTVIDSHGADAMRFTLASMTTETQDIRMPVVSMTLPDGRQANTSPKFDIGRNFCNKLWNASRFAMMNLEGVKAEQFDKDKMTVVDRWILSRLARTISETTGSLENYQFSEPLSAMYKFFWNDFCDWYLEWIKSRMKDAQQKGIAQNVLAFVLDQILRLLHPFVPFITEGVFQKLNEIAPVRKLNGIAETEKSNALVIAQWPKQIDGLIDEQAEKEIELVQKAVSTIRDIRSNRNIPPRELLQVSIKTVKENADILNRNVKLIEQSAGVKGLQAGVSVVKPDNANVSISDVMAVYVHYALDIEAERAKLTKQKEQVEGLIKTVEVKLSNENFVAKAKPAVVKQTKEKLAELTEQLKQIEKHLREMEK